MKAKNTDIIMQNKVFIWIAMGTGLILLIPLVLTLLNIANGGVEGRGWYWRPGDFIVMGALLFGMGSMFVLAARKIDKKYRVLIGLAFVAATLYLWAELAVGIFTNIGS